MSISLKLDENLKNGVRQLAEIRQRSAHWIMCEAIRLYVEHENHNELLKQEALQAWEDYQETGLHATGDEVKTWLKTWGTDNEQEAPECHE